MELNIFFLLSLNSRSKSRNPTNVTCVEMLQAHLMRDFGKVTAEMIWWTLTVYFSPFSAFQRRHLSLITTRSLIVSFSSGTHGIRCKWDRSFGFVTLICWTVTECVYLCNAGWLSAIFLWCHILKCHFLRVYSVLWHSGGSLQNCCPMRPQPAAPLVQDHNVL